MKQKMMNSTILTNETGRSMVEMLGVLAIIGVLSVGGVYGYGVAMKKHKANELLHQASMLAATVSAQIESLGGDLPEKITDFGSTNYGTFSTSVSQTEDKKKFVLTIQDVDSAVCDQLKKGGMVQGVDCKAGSSEGKKNAEITYYKNLATTEAEGEKSPTGGTVDIACKDVVCGTQQKCIGGECFNSECSDSNCECFMPGINSRECSQAKPYCLINDAEMRLECASTAEGTSCTDGAECSGTDAPYCNSDTKKCSKQSKGALCGEPLKCGSDAPYCVESICLNSCEEGKTCITADYQIGTCNAGVCIERNCWKKGNCSTADDLGSYSAFCLGGAHIYGYCDTCVFEGEYTCTDENDIVQRDKDYIDCMAEGGESVVCFCEAYEGAACDTIHDCVASGKTESCCECLGETGSPDICKDAGVCPNS